MTTFGIVTNRAQGKGSGLMTYFIHPSLIPHLSLTYSSPILHLPSILYLFTNLWSCPHQAVGGVQAVEEVRVLGGHPTMGGTQVGF